MDNQIHTHPVEGWVERFDKKFGRFGKDSLFVEHKDFIYAELLAARADERKKLWEVLEGMKARDREKPKCIRVAEALGKNPSMNGPIAQARTDGYIVALTEAQEKIKV